MPFVDINSIAPKVSATSASDDTTDVKEIKGPALSTAPTVPISTTPVAAPVSAVVTPPPAPVELPPTPPIVEKAPEPIMPPSFSIELPSNNNIFGGNRPATNLPEMPAPVVDLPKAELPKMELPKEEPATAADSLLEVTLPVDKLVPQAAILNPVEPVASPVIEPAVTPVEPVDLQSTIDQVAAAVPAPKPVDIAMPQVPEEPKTIDPLDIESQPGAAMPSGPIPTVSEAIIPPVEPKKPFVEEIKPEEVKPIEEVKPVEIKTEAEVPKEEVVEQAAEPKEESNLTTPEVKMEGAVEREYDLDTYLNMAVEMGASDIHLRNGYRVTIRLHGELKPLPSSMVLTEDHVTKFAKQMFDYKGISEQDVSDLDMAYQLPSNHRFRVNIFKQQRTYGLVFRLIPNKIPTIKDLSLPSIVLDFARLPYGLVLVTGATGSGKSTTLASIINHINMTQAKHIITIEDPVEYVYGKGKSLIDQREILQDTKSWAVALRSALREDPNVLLIGEMRDYETIASAIRIAETGQLVFGTLHTNNAAQTVERIVDVFPEQQQSQIRVQLANTLQAVISQRLVPTTDGTGRKPAVEILVANEAVRTAIRDNKTHQINNIIQTGGDVGMMSLEKSLVQLVRDGLITVEKAQEYTTKPDEILTMLSKTN